MTSVAVILDQMKIQQIKERLPQDTVDAWEHFRSQHHAEELPTFNILRNFLETRAKARLEAEDDVVVKRETTYEMHSRSKSAPASSDHQSSNRNRDGGARGVKASKYDFGYEPPTQCIMTGCKQAHFLAFCPAFLKLSRTDRMEVVKEHRLCRCCLMAGHMSSACKRSGCRECPDAKPKHHHRICSKQQDTRVPKGEEVPSKSSQ